MSSKDQSISKLTIRNVSTKDQGDYHCFVSEWKTKARSKTGRLHGKQISYWLYDCMNGVCLVLNALTCGI